MDDRLKPLDRLVPPDQWDEIQSRIPTLERQAPPPLGRRIAAIAVAAVLVTGVTFAVVRAIPDGEAPRPGGSPSGTAPSPRSVTQPPSTPSPRETVSMSVLPPAVPGIGRLPGSGTLAIASHNRLSEISAGSSTVRRVAVPADFSGCCGISVSPDGSMVAYGTGGDGHAVVRIADISDGSIVATSPSVDSARFVTWSPDGTAVVFNDGTALETYSLHGDVLSVLTDTPSECIDVLPAWSPASAALAFVRECDRGHRGGVYVMPNVGAAPSRVVGTGGGGALFDGTTHIVGMTWSPDATEVAVETADGAVWRIGLDHETSVMVPAAGGSVPGYGTIAWSPDGGSIAFVRGGGIALLEIGSGRVVTLASARGSTPTSISWTPAS